MEGRPVKAVDLGEGWAIVSYWLDDVVNVVVTNGDAHRFVSAAWSGGMPTLRFEGGAEARREVIRCAMQ